MTTTAKNRIKPISNKKSFSVHDDQRLDAASYLIRLANYNTRLNKRPQLALHLLESAAAQLNKIYDPHFTPLQQQLSKDITTLKSLPTSHIENIVIQLQSLASTITTLPLAEPTSHQPVSPQAVLGEKTHNWKTQLTTAWQNLQKLIIIRHPQQMSEPLLRPKQRRYLLQNIQAKLNMAAWAATEHHQDAYVAMLEQTIKWLPSYFQANDLKTQNIIKQLTELKKRDVDPSLPDLSRSYNLAANLRQEQRQ